MKLTVVVFFLMLPFYLFSQEKNYTIDTIQIKSEVLKENRNIIIFKPQGILNRDSVKFLYFIDGEFSNYWYHELQKRFGDSTSDVIAVGIINSDRRRDLLYVNGADKFLEFITTELIPEVEKDYKTKTRILYGHSFGGAFTIYSLINKPDFFNCYIAASPTPIMGLVKKEDYQRVDSLSKNKIVFYFGFGSKDMKQVRKWAQVLKDNLTGMEFKNFDWRFKVFKGKSHNSSGLPALFFGFNNLVKSL
jgi:predicted alpha/beta superfamily hydrolase